MLNRYLVEKLNNLDTEYALNYEKADDPSKDLYRIQEIILGDHKIDEDNNNLVLRNFNFNTDFNDLQLSLSGYVNRNCLHDFIYYYNDANTLNKTSYLKYMIKIDELLSGGKSKYYYKYLKYKNKYLELKNKNWLINIQISILINIY